MKTCRKPLMQVSIKPIHRILISFSITLLLILFVSLLKVPNPNMILIVGLVFSSAVFGYCGGITASVAMLLYTLYFFSTDHSFVYFTSQNLQKVFVSLFGILADMLLVCSLKNTEQSAFREVEALAERLIHENEHLARVSHTDGLTGIRNRMALQEDNWRYFGHDVTLMMVDLDKFKAINDQLGHEEGDRVLKEVGDLLARAYGATHCYRYGGDEFIVICPDIEEEEFRRKLQFVQEHSPRVTLEEHEQRIGLSAGYARRYIWAEHILAELLTQADQRMYRAKHAAHS
ncbi:MAG: GGDEF domain-containing protein [bacterium]